MSKYIKAIAAFLGGVTPGAVIGILALFGVHMDAVTVASIIGVVSPVLALVATWRAPANAVDVPTSVAPAAPVVPPPAPPTA